jgi:hypothetical protein
VASNQWLYLVANDDVTSDEASAREFLTEYEKMPTDQPYMGLWAFPYGSETEIHVFARATNEEIAEKGFRRA